MRVTVSPVPEDVAKAGKVAAKTHHPLSEAANKGVGVERDILLAPHPKPYRTIARPLGLKKGMSYDNIGELIACAEGEACK